MITLLIILFFAYLVGAIPTGYIIARNSGISDIRTQGSGNIGATNVARVLGIKYFFLVFSLDGAKAFLFLKLLAYAGLSDLMMVCAAGALLVGNGFSVFLHFSGGKGVATVVGILAALAPHLLLLVALPWSVLILLTKTMGVACVGAALSLPFLSLLVHDEPLVFYGTLGAAFWIFLRHMPNMRDYLTSAGDKH